MSRTDSRDRRERALQRLVRDARAESSPDLDWSRIEGRLLQQAEPATPSPKRSPYPLVGGVLAIAAAAAVWMASTSPPRATQSSRPSEVVTAASTARDGDQLAIGSRIDTKASEALVVHPGRASWTLSPNSSALLAGRDDRITVRLERGSVLSQVVPNPQPETFVVEAARTRIAVHGTLFSVALEHDHVIVQVRDGLVAVGPLGGAPAFLLSGGSKGDFAADGRSGRIDGRPVSAVDSRPAEPQKQAPARAASVAASSAPVASVEPPSEPSINDIETGIARIVDATTDCFARYTQSTDGVRITVHTALSLQILDSGAAADVDFQPPLSPDTEACAAARIADLRFAPSKQGVSVKRMLELKK